MQKVAFKEWLKDKRCYSSDKQLTDCLSRVRRAEEALSAVIPLEDGFDGEFERDGGATVRLLLSKRGLTPEMQRYDVPLPIGSNQMDSIAAAVRKYFLFLASMEKS